MNIKILAEQLGIADYLDLVVRVEVLNREYKLGLSSSEFTRAQYDTVRSLLDPVYLVKLLNTGNSDRKYDYTSTPDFPHIDQWVSDNILNGFSTADIKHSLPDHITHRGHQVIASVMRSNGYESKVVTLDTGGQGRRWFNDETWNNVSFL